MPSTNQTKQQRRRARARQKTGKLAPQRNNIVSAPNAQNRSSHQKGGKNSNSTRYKECERIGTVTGSVAYANILNIPANPALPGSFPWLAGHASLYEKYRIHSLIYRYKNLKGTSTDGNIIMSFDYDTLDSPPPDAISQSQSTVWIDGAPWRIFEMKVPVDSTARFTRTGDVSGSDLKTYDFGRLHVSAEGCSDTSSHGYLEVEYDIECFDKQKSSIVSQFQTGLGDTPRSAYFDAIDQTITSNTPFKLDSVNDTDIIQYDPFTGLFMPDEGLYRIEIPCYERDYDFNSVWGRGKSENHLRFCVNLIGGGSNKHFVGTEFPLLMKFKGDGSTFFFESAAEASYSSIYLVVTKLH